MRVENPFNPAFGGKPRLFFGRRQELGLIEEALANDYSPYRTMFLTANRGYGKTALLERASLMAQRNHWLTVDVHSTNAATAIIKQLVGGTARSTEKAVEPEFMGASFGGVRSTTLREYEMSDLSDILLHACTKLTTKKGLFITIDEVQKIGERDMESICAAAQMSMRKGMPVILLLAGLPGAKQKVSSYEGCTFMQRAWEMELGSLLIDETVEAFRIPLEGVESLVVDDEALWELAQFSQGFPYLIQLLGYYLVDRFGSTSAVPPLPIDVAKAASVEEVALLAYDENVLEPVMRPLGGSLRDYLKAMAGLLNDEGSASTGDVAASLGKTLQQCSTTRDRLLSYRLIAEDGRGSVRFAMPHLSTYLLETLKREKPKSDNVWNIR